MKIKVRTDWMLVGLAIPMALAGLALIGLVLDNALAEKSPASATVLEKSWSPSRSSTGIGVPINPGSGNGGIVLTTDSSPESFGLIIEVDGTKNTLEVSKKMYLACKAGDTITVLKCTGWLTKHVNFKYK